MSLEKYQEKRNFTKTTEPKGGKGTGKALTFVVQRHHASHLHYDFRLELDGVLKSWAVPKGPSMSPGDKRLAMMVEDHPFDYQYFEGVIPNGEYGGGIVITWDHGTYTSLAENRTDDVKTLEAGLKAGNLKFRLNGEILKGEFALVKSHYGYTENSWLLIKHKDAFAATGTFNSEDFVPDNIKSLLNNKDSKVKKLPKHHMAKAHFETIQDIKPESAEHSETEFAPVKPMMATLRDELPEEMGWLYEKKLDGYRAIGYTGSEPDLYSRNGISFKEKYKEVVEYLKTISKEAIIDGELVLEDAEGNNSFQSLQNYESSNKKLTLRYYVFDLLELDGHNTQNLPLEKRKELLKVLLADLPEDTGIIYSGHLDGSLKDIIKTAEKGKWEGIIAKDSQSVYESGRRSARWLKFKFHPSQEAVICGFTEPKGQRKYIGALLLGINEGGKLRYAGNCGTGFNTQTLKELYDLLKPLATKEKPFVEKPHQQSAIIWVKPEVVCEVTYAQWTDDRMLRHAVYKGLRQDKTSEKVTPETPDKQLPDEEVINYGKKSVKLTNQNKVFWKQEGITKGELLHYYKDIAPLMLPYLKDKPISMRRQPNGADAPGFFQKDVGELHLPEWMKTAKLHSDSTDEDIRYIVANDDPTLLYLVNLGCIEINPWLSSYPKPEYPEFLVIDIDPHDVPFTEAVEVALKTKEVFDQMQLPVYIKTSGSKGVHIYCYVAAQYDYDFVRGFAQFVAQRVHEQLPDTTSLERNPAKRKNKTYIDYMQNNIGQTIAAPYSVRPRPGATISAPLHWHEVNNELSLASYTIYTMHERLKTIANPWEDLFQIKIDLRAALQAIKQ